MSGVEEIIIALLVQMHIISEINRVPVVEGRGYKFDRSWEPKFYNIVNLHPSLSPACASLGQDPNHCDVGGMEMVMERSHQVDDGVGC